MWHEKVLIIYDDVAIFRPDSGLLGGPGSKPDIFRVFQGYGYYRAGSEL